MTALMRYLPQAGLWISTSEADLSLTHRRTLTFGRGLTGKVPIPGRAICSCTNIY